MFYECPLNFSLPLLMHFSKSQKSPHFNTEILKPVRLNDTF